jgi:hypothetical protein
MPRLRTVREENSVRDYIDAVIAKHKDVDRMYDGLKWRLSHRPQDGTPTQKDPKRYMLKILPPSTDLPVIAVLYKYDANHVNITHIRAIFTNTPLKKPS